MELKITISIAATKTDSERLLEIIYVDSLDDIGEKVNKWREKLFEFSCCEECGEENSEPKTGGYDVDLGCFLCGAPDAEFWEGME